MMGNSLKLAAAIAAGAALLAGGAAGQTCTKDGRRGMVVGDLGYESLTCRGRCLFHTHSDDGRVERSASFGSEPVITSVSGGSQLREGDAIVSIDGVPITSENAGDRFVNVRPGERVRLGVRRGGQVQNLDVVAGRRCEAPPAPPRPPAAPLAPAAPTPPAAPAPPSAPRAYIPSPPTPPAAPAPAAPPAPPAPPAAPAPPAPPPPPPAILPAGWFGFGVDCTACGWEMSDGEHGTTATWSFQSPPRVRSVEGGSPAARAGLRTGDYLEAIDGVPLGTPEGGRRFARVRPGQDVRWTVRRGGQRFPVVLHAERRPDAAAPRAASEDARRLRYSGSAGNVDVEVRGAPVTVSTDQRTGEVVIRSADVTVRLRPKKTR